MTTRAWSSSRQVPAAAAASRIAEHLRVRGRIVSALAFVVATGDDPTGREVDQDRAHGHVVVVERGAGLLERGPHPSVELFGVDADTGGDCKARAAPGLGQLEHRSTLHRVDTGNL